MTSRGSEKTVTASGIPVITEYVPGTGAGFLAAVRTGSRDEREGIFGISHLLEHTVFRETETMDSYEMAKVMEGAGGELNAFTGKEMTGYYGVTLAETGKVAMDMVADIVAHPRINEKDTELEKKIVLQEINMVRNDPESYVQDLFEENLWRGSPLGWDEAGSAEAVEALTFEDLREYYADRYGRPNIAVFATGEFDKSQVVEWAEEAFSGMEAPTAPVRSTPAMHGAEYNYVKHHSEHVQIAMGFPSNASSLGEMDQVSVLMAVLGAGTSSRLFQQVREKNALVYSVYSTSRNYSDAGYMAAYISCTADNVVRSLQETVKVFRGIVTEGLEEGELERTKNLLKGMLSRSAETTDSRLYRLCRGYMTYGCARGIFETLDQLSRVTEEDVMKAAEKFIRADSLNVTVLGTAGKDVRDFDISSLDL